MEIATVILNEVKNLGEDVGRKGNSYPQILRSLRSLKNDISDSNYWIPTPDSYYNEGIMMLSRLIFAVLTTVLQEVAIALIVLLVFPRMGVPVFIPGLVLFMLAWAAGCTLVYRAGSRALKRKTLTGLWSLVGGTARVVTRLSPEGKVRIHDELWAATSSDGAVVNEGEEVVVVKQEGLRLVVRRLETGDRKTSV